MPEKSLKYRTPPNGQRDSAGDLVTSLIEVDGSLVGHFKKAKFGKGFFLCVHGKKWTNAPGARYPQEKDFKAEYTYCKTKKEMEQRLLAALAGTT